MNEILTVYLLFLKFNDLNLLEYVEKIDINVGKEGT